jgi:hypothetical protein
MRPDEFRKKYGIEASGDEQGERDHSLQENAWERAVRLHQPNAGTPHDWEDWEHASERFGIDVETSEDPDDPTRPHPELISKEDDQPRVIDWIMTRLRRLRRRITGR